MGVSDGSFSPKDTPRRMGDWDFLKGEEDEGDLGDLAEILDGDCGGVASAARRIGVLDVAEGVPPMRVTGFNPVALLTLAESRLDEFCRTGVERGVAFPLPATDVRGFVDDIV